MLGVNGAGKSTLLKLVTGATEPDAGSVTLGGSVKLGYFAQHAMDLLDGERTVFETLEDAFPARRPGLAARAGGRRSGFPATRWRSAAACCRAARRRGW